MTAVCALCGGRHPVAAATLKLTSHGCHDVGWLASTLTDRKANR